MTPAELYFAQDLRLPIDLLHGSPPKTEEIDSFKEYLRKVKRKLREIHENVKKRVNIKFSQIKT